ncbi:MAG: cobyrinate a,c-diamide synthase [Synechococcales cyanobacterium C42_A2020_086]|jgi:cobyrinic acid a,c-diamide synthase|nr:cobyrinate a,c-diamide synthase [Synechococcales cyanobacterium C42_A2020_086]
MALIIAGERSGVGKTTVTLAILAALRQWQRSVQSFKVGPDYIDPMFHAHITGRPCRNLDPVLTSESYVQQCFARHSATAEYALVEGVMGLFDGASGSDDWASTAHIARLLHLPILLVLDCSRLSRSVAAIVHGYRTFDPRLQLAGIVLNRVGSDRHLDLLKAALEPLQVPILGVLKRDDAITLPDRHLGLVPTAELPMLSTVIQQLANLGTTGFDWTPLLPLLRCEPPVTVQPPVQPSPNFSAPSPATATPDHSPMPPRRLRIAVARDPAFSFYYADNLELLTQLGADIVEWSPLQDERLPGQVSGLYFGGGFPEMFAAILSANEPARQAVRTAIAAGMPTYAECGGLMYLTETLVDFDGNSWRMVGILPTTAQMGQRLTLGYRCAVAQHSGPLLPLQAQVWGHEFHRSHLTALPNAPLYHLWGYEGYPNGNPRDHGYEGWRQQQVHASYVHLHWGARPEIPARFLAHCDRFGQTQPS